MEHKTEALDFTKKGNGNDNNLKKKGFLGNLFRNNERDNSFAKLEGKMNDN